MRLALFVNAINNTYLYSAFFFLCTVVWKYRLIISNNLKAVKTGPQVCLGFKVDLPRFDSLMSNPAKTEGFSIQNATLVLSIKS